MLLLPMKGSVRRLPSLGCILEADSVTTSPQSPGFPWFGREETRHGIYKPSEAHEQYRDFYGGGKFAGGSGRRWLPAQARHV